MERGGRVGGLVDAFEAKLASKGQSSGCDVRREERWRCFSRDVGWRSGGGAGEGGSGQPPERKGGGGGQEGVHAESGGRRPWKEVEMALLGEIKRRNYSPKTARTYLTWVQRFGQFTHLWRWKRFRMRRREIF